MITEEDLANAGLTGKSPEQQFRYIEQCAAKHVTQDRYPNDEFIYDEHDYMSAVLAAAQVFEIDELKDWQLPSRGEANWAAVCSNFRSEATLVSQRILFRYAVKQQDDPNSVALEPALKERLRFHIGQVRGVIDEAQIQAWRKQELYDALANLEAEIDKARTHLSTVFEVVAKTWQGDIELPDALRQIITIIQDAKSKEKAAPALSASTEPKRIEGPKTKVLGAAKSKGKNGGFNKPLDDEIPF